MRRRAATVLIIAVAAAVFVGIWAVAYRMGESDGRAKVSADRSTFQTRAAGNPQGSATGGLPGGTPRTRAAAGSAVVDTGTPSAGSGSNQRGSRGAAGSPVASGTGRPSGVATSSIAGHVTKIAGATVSVQQADTSLVTVTTTRDTAINTLVSGVLTDLKTGDVIAVDGAKTGDASYSAKTITSLGHITGGTGGGAGRPTNVPPQGVSVPVVTGRITSMNGGTITVQGFDGATVTITSSPATVVKTQQSGTLSDIKNGDLLLVVGDKTSDTEFVARSITNQGASSG